MRQHPPELDWPFFEDSHRDFKLRLDAWCNEHLAPPHGNSHHDESRDAVDAECVRLVRLLGRGGWLRHAVAGTAYGAASDAIDTRQLCLLRETLAFHNGLSDFAFAMQGLGTGAISLAGTHAHKQAILPRVARGEWISAFALTEPLAGSDVGAMQCEARLEGDHYVITGEKTWISNGGIADVYCLFARTGEAPGARGISAFIITPDMPGFEVAERLVGEAAAAVHKYTRRVGQIGRHFD